MSEKPDYFNIRKYEMSAHAKLSASGAHRWANCPGSVLAEDGIADTTSDYADEGTFAHQISEDCLRDGENAEACIGRKSSDGKFTVDKEMADYCQQYIDHVRQRHVEIGGTIALESVVSFDRWVPEGYGTADVIICNGEHLEVIDLKYGKGVQVFAADNPQPVLYALGALQELDDMGMADSITTVSVTIHQPRLDHVDTADYTLQEILDFGAALHDAANAALSDNPPRVPSEKACQWCKASGNCDAEADWQLKQVCGEFAEWEANMAETLEDPAPVVRDDGVEAHGGIDPDKLSLILAARPGFVKWLDKVKDRATEIITDGGTVPGFKMVPGKTSRSWEDEEKAGRALKRALTAAKAYKKTILTPPQAEKLLGKGHILLKNHVTTAQGAPTLVPASDKREAIDYSPVDTEEDFLGIE